MGIPNRKCPSDVIAPVAAMIVKWAMIDCHEHILIATFHAKLTESAPNIHITAWSVSS